MDSTTIRCLVNSISRFVLLVTSRVSNAMPVGKDYIDVGSLLKHLKPALDDVLDLNVPLDEPLLKECEELDTAVNDAREFLENWSPRMSKILSVLQSKPLVVKIQMSTVRLSGIICTLLESSPNKLGLSNAQLCIEESQEMKLGQISKLIEEIFECQKDGDIHAADNLSRIVESLKLKSSQEILNENISVEKEKQKAEDSKLKKKSDQIAQAVDLMSRIRGYVSKLEKFRAVKGIEIPSYFLCPLSLELMSDPVIVSSGQTYERAAIEKWLDSGLERCPQTGNKLSHKNLICNFTVKALIANWCHENKIELARGNGNGNANTDKIRSPSERTIFEESRASCEVRNGETAKFDQSSPEHSYVHSRSESESSAVSSIDFVPGAESEVSGISSKQDSVNNSSPETNSATVKSRISGASSFSRKQYSSSKMTTGLANRQANHSRVLSFSTDSEYNELTSTSHVEKLIDGLKCDSAEVQTAAAGELRHLAKYNNENRIIIGDCGAIAPLISLLHSDVELTQEHAVTALLNLSICESIKVRIAEEGAIEQLINVLRTGNSGAKENAAAALFSISLLDEYRIKIGRSAAVKSLVELLGSGTVRGKKDAATALFNLSIFHDNKARIVQAGAVKHLVGFLDPAAEMVDKAAALLANLSTIPEGCSAIAREGGIPSLVETLDNGSQRGKENAASILLQLCLQSSKYCRSVLQEGAVPPLVALSQSGTPRAKEKAQQLLGHFRSLRDSAIARGKS
ncbi:U-box domain-containing protein 3 [Andrographis paniculata]|uniref:U-box domain-containing protein 3 n=1 Tax=Andrographis paniculata TaxID=175694 RepID=UPI0021E8188F|nr:U-box domain-containing protein 3 [Andrographis paniculata]XP_051142135.1 U-box domain-containing protein 3 [Andrographis paniculata]XP_051142136.1 U-box domain-containing protein 3 [Andrographis paniculata]